MCSEVCVVCSNKQVVKQAVKATCGEVCIICLQVEVICKEVWIVCM